MKLGNTIESERRHELFVQRVLESRVIWGLRSQDGWAQAPSNFAAGVNVIPFWSDRAYAAQCAAGEWSSYVPTEVPLEAFLQAWLPGMAQDGILAGTNWNVHLVGNEADPMQLHTQLAVGAA